MAECVFCNYRIKDCKTTPRKQLTRKDLASFEFFGKWICGDDHDSLYEFLEGESSPDVIYAHEPKTTAKTQVIQMDNENNGTLLATDKQKQYIIDLTERMTREQANRVIDVLKSGATNSYTPAKTNGELPITEKQKACIKEIYSENDWNWDEEEISSMTRKEASELISGCIEGGAE